MASNLAIDFFSGDLIVAPNNGFALRTGPQCVQQRVHVRLKVIQGAWILDPSNGTLGSRINEIFRLPAFRAIPELELAIREALEPMQDIDIQDIVVTTEGSKTLVATISYVISDDAGGTDLQTISAKFGSEGD